MTKSYEVRLPDGVAGRLDQLDESRVNSVFVESLREVLDLAEDAEARREALRNRMGLSGKDVEELDEGGETAAERKQAELREKIGGPR